MIHFYFYFAKEKCRGALYLCSETTLDCTQARHVNRPWTNDLKGATTEGTCCFEVFQMKRRRGEKFKITPGNDGITFVDFAVMSIKRIEC